jgi:3-oxoacyl-[acyl-carrier protein] reductase
VSEVHATARAPLDGRVAVVSGANHGIGAATAAALARLGAEAYAVEADLADAGAPARVFAEAEAAGGPGSILVNNASG